MNLIAIHICVWFISWTFASPASSGSSSSSYDGKTSSRRSSSADWMPSAEGGTFSLFTMPLRLNSTSEFHDENDVVMIDEHWHLLSRFLRTHFEVHHRSDSDFFDFDASEGILYEASSGQKNPPKSFAFGEQAEILTRRKRFFLLGFMLVASEMILPYVLMFIIGVVTNDVVASEWWFNLKSCVFTFDRNKHACRGLFKKRNVFTAEFLGKIVQILLRSLSDDPTRLKIALSKIQAEFDKLKLSGHRHVTMEQFLKSVGIRIPHNTLEHDARHDLEPHLRDFHYDVMKIAMEHLSDEGRKLIELRFAEHKKREQERDEHDFADRRSELEGNSIFGLGSQINRRIMNPSPSMHELLELERNKGMVLEKTLDVALAEAKIHVPSWVYKAGKSIDIEPDDEYKSPLLLNKYHPSDASQQQNEGCSYRSTILGQQDNTDVHGGKHETKNQHAEQQRETLGTQSAAQKHDENPSRHPIPAFFLKVWHNMMNIFNSRNNNKLPSVASLSDQATDKKETEKGRDHRLKDCPHAKQKYHHLERRKTVRRRKRSFMVTWFIPNTISFILGMLANDVSDVVNGQSFYGALVKTARNCFEALYNWDRARCVVSYSHKLRQSKLAQFLEKIVEILIEELRHDEVKLRAAMFEVECEFEKLGRVGAEGATLIDILLGLELITQEDLERMNKKEEGEKSSSDGIEFEEERRAVEQVRGAITIVELELQQLPPR